MRFESIIRRAMFACSAVLLATVCAFAPSAFAQKGGSGSGTTGGGTIYFINGAGGGYVTNYLWSMNSDGSSVTQWEPWGRFQFPSRALHGGHRWHLTTLNVRDELTGEYLCYGDGVTRRTEVFAFRDDYDYETLPVDPLRRVQLTNDPNFQPGFSAWGSGHWLPGDARISFKGRRWDGAAPVEGGLYTADLDYDANGNIVGLSSGPTLALAFPLGSTGWPAFGAHSWGLSTTQVAYSDSPETGLWIADLSTGTRTRIYAGTVAYLDWSSDGTKLLFGSGTIRTIKPNGATLRTVLGPRYVGSVWVSGFGHAYFSPTGSHITCVGIMNLAGGVIDNDVIRATSSGGSVANLTNTPTINELPIAWR